MLRVRAVSPAGRLLQVEPVLMGHLSSQVTHTHGSPVLIGLVLMGHTYSWATHTWITRAALERPCVALSGFR